VRDDEIQVFLKGAPAVSSPTASFIHILVISVRIMHASEHLVPHLAHATRVPFGYHNLCL
jgi:hypothetical protein